MPKLTHLKIDSHIINNDKVRIVAAYFSQNAEAYRFDWLYSPLGLYGIVLLKKLRIHNKKF